MSRVIHGCLNCLSWQSRIVQVKGSMPVSWCSHGLDTWSCQLCNIDLSHGPSWKRHHVIIPRHKIVSGFHFHRTKLSPSSQVGASTRTIVDRVHGTCCQGNPSTDFLVWWPRVMIISLSRGGTGAAWNCKRRDMTWDTYKKEMQPQ